MKATIRDVARKAGVSIGTVSRVLNGHPAVSDDSRSRVDAVVRSLNYFPLRKRRSPSGDATLQGKRVAILGLGLDHALSSLPFIGEAIHGAQAALTEGGASVEFLDLPRLDNLPAALRQECLDGLILFGALQGNLVQAAKPVLIKRLSALPSVWFQRRPEGCWGDSVGPNDYFVGKLAAQHLLAHGHQRIAFLNPKAGHTSWSLRGLSLAWHAEEQGAKVKSYSAKDDDLAEFPLSCELDMAVIEGLVETMLKSSPRPTAVFIPADSLAPYVYRLLSSRGISIGKDLSVMSCNYERLLTTALYPTLATIDIHANLIGRGAVEQLTRRFREDSVPGVTVEISVEPTLVEGESVANIS